MEKKLYRSRHDRKIGGVCAGLAEYYGTDATIIRLAAVLLVFADGIGLLAYIVGWIIMPERPLVIDGEVHNEPPERGEPSSLAKFLPGLILIIIGLVFIVNKFYWWFDFGDLWPVALIVVGIFLLIKYSNSGEESDHTIQSGGGTL